MKGLQKLCFHLARPDALPSLLRFFQIRRQAIKELPRFATGDNILRVSDILTQLLQTGEALRASPSVSVSELAGEPVSSGSSSDDSAEFNQVTAALISIFKIDAKGKPRALADRVSSPVAGLPFRCPSSVTAGLFSRLC